MIAGAMRLGSLMCFVSRSVVTGFVNALAILIFLAQLPELTGMPSGHSEPPEDPRLARLLPDFEQDSDQPTDGENAMLRMLNESEITEAKLEQLRVVLDALADSSGNGEVVLTAEQAQSWIAGLNDLRLYLHVTLENLAGPMEQSQQVDAMYQWLGYNQESLLEELMRE